MRTAPLTTLRSLPATWLAMALLLSASALAAAADPGDPVVQLQKRLDDGAAHLSFEPGHGWLESLLRELHVPKDSQSLVFSKTSFQEAIISSHSPRALYFNDDLYVGWVQGGAEVEIASVDPQRGTVFYTLPQKPSAHPTFDRQDVACTQCHQSEMTGGVPGLLMRSVYPDPEGMPVLSGGSFVTTPQSPLMERWGGWYVDGKVPTAGMGNAVIMDAAHPESLSPTTFREQFDQSLYLTTHSDPVALMLLAHQTHLHNLLTRAHEEVSSALRDEKLIARILKEPQTEHSDTTLLRLRSACDPIVEAILFSGEAPLNGAVEGSSNYARDFERLGPSDHLGRSLRQFDMHRRMFRYPCSYLIYSEQFDALPELARQYIYRRMWKILTGRDDSAKFNHLTESDRDAIYSILADTKPGLPAYWKRER